MLQFVKQAEESARTGSRPETKPGAKGPGRSKKIRIRELENELEETWCCIKGLVPVGSSGTAYLLFLLNLVVPGLGTILSIMFAEKNPIPDPRSETEADDPDADQIEIKSLEGEVKDIKPPVVSVSKKVQWSAGDAILTGLC